MDRQHPVAGPELEKYRACCIDLAVAAEAYESRARRFASVLHSIVLRGTRGDPAKSLEKTVAAARAALEADNHTDHHKRGARVLDYLREGG